jgi:hypothetical protein
MSEGVWCFIVCFGVLHPTEPPVTVDTFCQSYQPVVMTKAELDQVLRLDRKLRDRIQGNDLDYLCRCKGWQDKACRVQVQSRK